MKKVLLFSFVLLSSSIAFAQENENKFQAGEIHGNFQLDAQNYYEDTVIGAQKVPESMRMNAFANINYTRGNFYEQFGSGLIFRSYEERGLGVDNAMDGIRLRYKPTKGVYIKGVIGQQRFFFEKGEGLVRGLDGEINLNEFFDKLSDKKI